MDKNIVSKIEKIFADGKENKIFVYGVVGASVLTGLVVLNTALGTDPIGRTLSLFKKFSVQERSRNIEVKEWINEYNTLHDDDKKGVSERNSAYATLVNAYYELATSFYEWGWGQSFHFAYQLPGIIVSDSYIAMAVVLII